MQTSGAGIDKEIAWLKCQLLEAKKRIESLREQIRRMFDQNWGPEADGGRGQRQAKRARSEEEQALAILGLEASASFTEIKSRYKKLAKQLHPDANGDSREAEERLKAVNQAYATLKKSLA